MSQTNKTRIYLGEKTLFKNPNVHEPAKKFNASKKIYDTYDLQFDKDHIVRVVKTGNVDIYAKIQTYANDNDFTKIMRSIEATQNPEMFVAQNNQFGDITSAPTSMLEAQKLLNEAEFKFNTNDYGQKKGMSLKDFAKIITDDDFIALVNERQNLQNKEKKEENN